ncbi:MAG TPA: sugar ABC transporter substrate-binding protein [Chloroflexota bacterium]|nr:sugar ABC transporter substrate-binding protein [Chloroflexota bacterium]
MTPAQKTLTRRTALLAAAAPAVSALAACAAPGGSGPAPGGVPTTPVNLSYLYFFGPDDPQVISYPYVIEQFQKKYPKVTIEQTTTNGTTSNVMEKYVAMIAGGTAPDVAAVNPQFIEPLRAKGALADLTPFVKRDSKSFQPEDFNEPTLARAIRDGKWTALPLQMGLWFLFYNTTALQQAGLGKPDATWTWDKLMEAARTVRGRDANNLGMTMPPYELPVRDNGGDILTADEKKCILDQPPAVEAIQWMGDLRQRQRAVPDSSETAGQAARALFDAGRYAFHIGDPGFLSGTIRAKLNFTWDIAVVPRGKVTQVSTVKGPSLVMSQDSKQKEAAWAWLAHYNGAEMQKYVATNGKVISARKTALKAFVDLPEGYTKSVIQDTAKIAKAMPYVARFDEMDKEISAGTTAVFNGQKTAKEAMADVVQKVNALLTG